MRNKGVFSWMLTALLLVGASDGWAADAPACDASMPVLRPLVQTHTQPPYPAMSVMTKEEGTTMLDVSIGTDGVPTDVQVSTSSGSLRLDEAARDHVKSVWRWSPPMRNCMPAAVKTRVSVRWSLKDAPGAPGLESLPPALILSMLSIIPIDEADYPSDLKGASGGMNLLLAVLSDSGTIEVAMIKPSGVPELDAKAIELAKTRYRWTPALLNAKPVGTAHMLMMVWTPPGGKKVDPKLLRDMMSLYIKGTSQSQAAPGTAPAPPHD